MCVCLSPDVVAGTGNFQSGRDCSQLMSDYRLSFLFEHPQDNQRESTRSFVRGKNQRTAHVDLCAQSIKIGFLCVGSGACASLGSIWNHGDHQFICTRYRYRLMHETASLLQLREMSMATAAHAAESWPVAMGSWSLRRTSPHPLPLASQPRCQ